MNEAHERRHRHQHRRPDATAKEATTRGDGDEPLLSSKSQFSRCDGDGDTDTDGENSDGDGNERQKGKRRRRRHHGDALVSWFFEDCLLCPTGFAANMAVMVALGNVGSLLAVSGKPLKDERIAIFSDALNHASIIDGIRLAEKQQNVEVYVYRHCDMSHLNALLSSCTMKKKVVVTDSLFSMDGDFVPMVELVKLRKKHGFLLVIDDAHGTFVCGKNGGGVAEEFNCERDVDICVGTLSKAAGCHGGFIACSKSWKQLIQSRGRSFIFSTATPVPIVAAAHAAVIVAKKEKWRRREIWNRVQDFHALTGIPITSPIISLIVGSEEKALLASRHLLKSGFHVTAIRPPTVPPNSCRLRVTLSAAHTLDDLKKLTTALSHCINFKDIGVLSPNGFAKL